MLRSHRLLESVPALLGGAWALIDTGKQEMRAEAAAFTWAQADGVGWAGDGAETRLGAFWGDRASEKC